MLKNHLLYIEGAVKKRKFAYKFSYSNIYNAQL